MSLCHAIVAGPLRWLPALSLLVGCAAAPPPTTPPPPSQASTASPWVAPPPALHLEAVPPVPQALMDALQGYTRVSGHQFVEWHPTRQEMLVAHRPPQASTTQLFRLPGPMAALEPLTDSADPVRSGSWEPRDGRYIVFARASGGDEAYQLYRLDLDTRAVTPLTDPRQRHSLQGWIDTPSLPRALAVVGSVPLDRTASGGTRPKVETTLSVLDPLDPPSLRVVATLPGGGWFGAEASPDGGTLAITRYVSNTESEVWLVDVATGVPRRVLPVDGAKRASHFVARWMPDGRSVLLTSDRAGEFRELMHYELATGHLVRLSADMPWDVSGVDVTKDGRLVAAIANVDGRDELRLIDPRQGAPRAQPPAALLSRGSVSRAAFHPAADAALALVLDSAQGPAQIHTLDLASGRTTAWTMPANPAALDLRELPSQQVVRWRSFDGREISGILSLPPARFEGRRPVVLSMHGGPAAQAKLGWQGRSNYLLQQLGVALFEPNVRGSSGYGKTFVSLDDGRLREDSVKDMASAIDWIATHPRLDASRVLVVGGSYGGYMALAASTRLADRIAGAMSVVGISHFVTFLENTESYRRDLRRVEYGDERDPAMRAFLEAISPLNRVDAIRRPLFVVQGRNDPRVPWTESEQIVRRLQQRGHTVWYMLADNEGHGFTRRENADHYFASYVQFVAQTLKP